MIEQPPQPQEKEGEKQLRDTAFWAEPVETLMVSEAPAGAINLNVAGRRVMGPLQGFGQLWQKTYRVELSGADVTPAEVVKIWKEKFPEFQPPQNRFYPSMAGVKSGEVLLINATVGGMPVYTGVRIIYADDESFTVMTPRVIPSPAGTPSARMWTTMARRWPRSSRWRAPTTRSTRSASASLVRQSRRGSGRTASSRSPPTLV